MNVMCRFQSWSLTTVSKFTSILYLSKKISIYFNQVNFYELLFTSNELQFLVNINFFNSLLLSYFGDVKSSNLISKRSHR